MQSLFFFKENRAKPKKYNKSLLLICMRFTWSYFQSLYFPPFLSHMNIQENKKGGRERERGGKEGKKGIVPLSDQSKIIYIDLSHPQREYVLWLKPGKDYSK